ncbi:type VII secretion-associated serine protease mycosin [Gordonia alkaliphila]|uniref:type VII secretion-associated serine protease mycosin n=1 Tax=Gordonia alkaliphila TaxID=1053547 RepID=UPI001FF49E4E|nr:type VII secretion-associated serine protease mycosin [Gordonia alkaliphila]MCK0439903.1 type VII secretion-associated serine protease mycosin [Gordonia alkaliphila]
MAASATATRLVAVAALAALAAVPVPAGARPDPVVAALVPVSAQPLGPAQPTEQRTQCARPAPLTADPAAEPAGHRLLDIAQAWRFSRGAGVTVAVIDTGITPHQRLNRPTAGGDYVSTGDGLTDCDLHGTLVAGIIAARPSADGFAGVAPEARLLAIRQSSGAYEARDRRGSAPSMGAGYGPLSTLAKAIVRATELGARVINISEAACLPAGTAVDDDAVASALAFARSRDAVVVAAAGNLSDVGGCREQNPPAAASARDAWNQVRSTASPARFGREILTVGAVDATTAAPTPFSLAGPWVTVAAPGTEVVSVAGGRLVDALDGEDGPRRLAGTSYATAYVSGVVALVRARFPELSADEVIDRIVRTARGGPDQDAATGYGVVDPVAALTADLPNAAATPPPTRMAAPRPDRPDHRAVITVVCTLAVGAAVLAAAFAPRRRRSQPSACTRR